MLMCDTFVHIPSDSSLPILFGKNSDREPNEAQQIVRYPRTTRDKNRVKTSYIEVEHPRDVFEVILSKPFRIWGAEIGINEHSVVIGNEAVFTKMPFEKKNTGLTGMDMIRLALEISKTAKEALGNIVGYVKQYGQDACGGYEDKNFFYNNSFIIADKKEAYVLETAGNFWVYEKVNGYRAISNGLSIEEKYDGISNTAIEFAGKKNWIKQSENFNFKKAFSSFWMPKLARCESRRSQNESSGKSMTTLSVKDAMGILRLHKQTDFSPNRAQPDSICMHASGLFSPQQTTGSMVAVLHEKPVVWLTGTASPCLSIYKPFYLGDTILNVENFITPSAKMDNSYWWQWEKFNRAVIKNYAEKRQAFAEERNVVEEKWIKEEQELRENNACNELFQKFSRDCLEESKSLLKKWSERIVNIPDKKYLFYDQYWNKQNDKVCQGKQ
jgi:dipeptidase